MQQNSVDNALESVKAYINTEIPRRYLVGIKVSVNILILPQYLSEPTETDRILSSMEFFKDD